MQHLTLILLLNAAESYARLTLHPGYAMLAIVNNQQRK